MSYFMRSMWPRLDQHALLAAAVAMAAHVMVTWGARLQRVVVVHLTSGDGNVIPCLLDG